MKTEIALKKLGLDDKQQALYLAALELGKASMSELSKKALLKRPTAYNAAHELQIMGLISQATVGKKKLYSAAHPSRLLEIAHSLEHQVDKSMPALMELYNMRQQKPKVQIFEGKEGVQLLYDEVYKLLNNRQEALWFTRIDALTEYLPVSVNSYKKLLAKVKNPRIRELNYGNQAGKDWIPEMKDYLAKNKNHRIRLLSEKYEFGFCDNMIFGNKLAIFSLKDDVFVIVIESEEIAKTYRVMFEWAWKMGKELKF